jgi:ABC-type uncharacterized transport system substrate-binding protein
MRVSPTNFVRLAATFTRLPALAAELAGMSTDVIVTDGPPAARAMKEVTTQVPVVI